MFSGIIENSGRFLHREGHRFHFAWEQIDADLKVGDSVAVNGTCLTVVGRTADGWEADVVDETLHRTNLGSIEVGERVNLERPVKVGGRLDGHIVQGHVDAVGVVSSEVPELRVSVPTQYARYIVEKGSITVDGVSLTVVDAADDSFSVAVIPHTSSVTTLGIRKVGDLVNLEFDVIGKYVERLLKYGSV